MTSRVVLDAAAFDQLHEADGLVRAVLVAAGRRGVPVWCSAVTAAEVSRGTRRTSQVAAALGRRTPAGRILVQPTDLPFARLVGSILHASGSGSEDIADAHVVALCAAVEDALVLTSDPDDVLRLAGALPGVRVLVRRL